jgi:hypothetical protein
MSFICLNLKRANYYFAITVFLLFISNIINAQKNTTITGSVIDNNGVVMVGVNVVEKGTKNSATTDLEGKYKINVAGSKSVLVFSSVGYDSYSQVVGTKTTIGAILKAKEAKLDDVVVIGYGTTKKQEDDLL